MGAKKSIQAGVEVRICDLLQPGQAWLKWQLVASTLHYRISRHGIVRFGVQERRLLQPSNGGAADYNQAAVLLKKVIDEWEVLKNTKEVQKALEQEEIALKKEDRRLRRINTITATAAPPPQRVVSGSPYLITGVEEVMRTMNALRQSILRGISAETTVNHSYVALSKQIDDLLLSVPGHLWPRLPIERVLAEDDALASSIERDKKVVYRALTALEAEQKIRVTGEGKKKYIQLVTSGRSS
jgi:hypothetical protein